MTRSILLIICLAFASLAADWPDVMPADTDATPTSVDVRVNPDGRSWRSVAVRSGDRLQPFDSAARSAWLRITGDSRVTDPLSGRAVDYVDAYLEMWLTWQGWDHPQLHQLADVKDWTSVYFRVHQPDAWDRADMFPVGGAALKGLLKMAADSKRISAVRLSQAKVVDSVEGRELGFDVWVSKLRERQDAGISLSDGELAGLELARRVDEYKLARMGRSIEFVPVTGDDDVAWMTIGELLVMKYHDVNDPTRELRTMQQELRNWRTALRAHDPASSRASADGLLASQRATASRLIGADLLRLRAEAIWNRFAGLTVAWGLMLVGGVWGLADLRGNRPPHVIAGTVLTLGAAMAVVAVGSRGWFAGRLPWWGAHELFSLAGAALAIAGLWLWWRRGERRVSAAVGILAAGLLFGADWAARGTTYEIWPVPAELYGNHWLTWYGMLAVLGFTLLGTSWAAALVGVLRGRVVAKSAVELRQLDGLVLRALHGSVVVLAWAALARSCWGAAGWGRDWGWSFDEVQLLVIWLSYVCVVYARGAGLVDDSRFRRAVVVMAVTTTAIILGQLHGNGFLGPFRLERPAVGAGGYWTTLPTALLVLAMGLLARDVLRPRSSSPAMLLDRSMLVGGPEPNHRQAA